MSDNEKENVAEETSSVPLDKGNINGSNVENDSPAHIDSDSVKAINPDKEDETLANSDSVSEFGDFDNEDSEFGDFDEDNDFGGFEESKESDAPNNLDNPMTLDEIFKLWSEFAKQMYTFQTIESFTNDHSTKNIKAYVLEEAQESLHSRLTWDSVTKYMEDDTGIPKVRWANSEIEKLHLKALSCQRSAAPITTAPTILDISQTNNPERQIETDTVSSTLGTMKSPMSNSPPIAAVSEVNSSVYNSPPTSMDMKTPTSPSSGKRSSIFGLSSLSRYLPHLSKSKLPSPTSPTAPSPTTPRIFVPNHNIVTSPPMNHMNIQQPAKEAVSHLKRSNTVAFSSSQPRMRPISSQSMDLLDLFDDDKTTSTSFTPLVPTASTSTPHQPRRYTIPANMHSDIKPTTVVEDDDDFGDFKGEDTDLGTNVGAFDVFSTSMVRSNTEPAANTMPKVMSPENTDDLSRFFNKQSDDPYDKASYFTKTTSPTSKSATEDKQSYFNNSLHNDPYDTASYFKKSTPPNDKSSYFVHNPDIPPQQTNDPLDLFFGSKPQPSQTIPHSVNKSSAKQELFDSFMKPATNDSKKPAADDEDWGDWAF